MAKARGSLLRVRNLVLLALGIFAGFVLLLAVQLLIGYRTIKRLVAKAMADFHLQPTDIDEASLAI